MSDLPLPDENFRGLSVMPSRNGAVPEPFDLPIDVFLTGKEGRELDVDPIFGQPLGEILENYDWDAMRCGLDVPAVSDRVYTFRKVDSGSDQGIVLVSSSNGVVGAYIGGALAIAPEHQGHGLGAELVFEFAYAFGVLPAWFMDVPAYSPAGVAAHRRAWHLAHEAKFMKAKQT
jgi:GNAT superfamily N-acetyltransferase